VTTSLAPRPAKRIAHQMCGFCEAGWGQVPGRCYDDHGRGKGTCYGAVLPLTLAVAMATLSRARVSSTLARPWACLQRPARRLFQNGMHTARRSQPSSPASGDPVRPLRGTGRQQVRACPVAASFSLWLGAELEIGNRSVRISNPGRAYFPARGETKLDLVRYYISVGDGIVSALRERPCMMHRFPSGVAGEKVHQKRVPPGAPPWLETVRVHFPRHGRHADDLCVTELASVVWAVQMSTVEFHPWNSRRADTERPDEWRIDLDPIPRCEFATVRRVARIVHEILGELGMAGLPKTSGGNGLHIYVWIEPRWGLAWPVPMAKSAPVLGDYEVATRL
jgi:DNA ligase D-like protein (predicted polymerase)